MYIDLSIGFVFLILRIYVFSFRFFCFPSSFLVLIFSVDSYCFKLYHNFLFEIFFCFLLDSHIKSLDFFRGFFVLNPKDL